MMKSSSSVAAFALAIALIACGCTSNNASNTPAAPAATSTSVPVATDATVKPYPLDHCVVSGDKLGGDMGDPITKTYKGQEIKFCCKDCIKDFDKDPDAVLAKVQAEVAAAEKPAVTDTGAAPAKAADPAKP